MNGIETKTTRNAEYGSGVTVVDVSSIRMTAMHQFSYNAFRRKETIQGVYHLRFQAAMPACSGFSLGLIDSASITAFSYGIEAVARDVSSEKLLLITCENRLVTGPGRQWLGRV